MKTDKKAFFTLFLIVATELIGFGLIIPVLPQLATRFDISGFALGVLLASYSLAQFIAAPILGSLSDKYGRKPILIFSKIGTVVGYLILAFAGNYWIFLLARLVDGFTGGNIAAARAYAADITSEENRSKGMAVIGISFGTGFVLGPALGGILYGIGNGLQIPAIVAACLSFLALIFTILFLKEPEKRTASKSTAARLLGLPSALRNRNLMLLLTSQLIYMCIFSGFETTLSVFTQQRFAYSPQQNSMLFLFSGVVILLIQGYLTRKTTKKGSRGALAGLGVTALAFLVLGVVSEIGWLFTDLLILAIGVCLLNVFLPSLVSLNSSASDRGQIMGVYESVGSLSRIVGPLVAYGAAAASFAPQYFVSGVLLAVLAGIFAVGYRHAE